MFYSPNSVFAEIRDNEQKYFAQSIGILVFATVLLGVLFIPVYMLLTSQIETNFENDDGVVNLSEIKELTNPVEIMVDLIFSLISEIVFIIMLFLVGRSLSGTRSWKKVFSVISHSYVISIPFLAVGVAFVYFSFFVIIDAMDQQEGDSFQPSSSEYLMTFLGAPFAILIFGFFVVIIWNIIVIIKATKVVNGFGTLKAIGILILATLASIAVQVPFGLVG